MKTKSPFVLTVRLTFGFAILTLGIVGAIFYHAIAVSGESGRHASVAFLLGTMLGLLIITAVDWRSQRDASRREAAQQAIQINEEKYRRPVQSILDYGILPLGRQGEIRSWNPGAERMTWSGPRTRRLTMSWEMCGDFQ
jgi:PAS domain-containing protein